MSNELNEEHLYHFLAKYGNNRVERELLAFWGRHPKAKFAKYAICYALDYNRLEVERALCSLMEAGLVIQYCANGVPLYSLTADEEKRLPIMELAALSWDQWQLMLRRMEREGRIVNCLI